MKVEIDQSNKVEKTSRDTIIGIAGGGKIFSVVIESGVKKKLQEEFRRRGKPRLFVYRTFIAGVALALKYSGVRVTEIVIDIEYAGQDRLLRSIFLEMWSQLSTRIPIVTFVNIGKKSAAHAVSYETMKKNREPDRILRFGELLKLTLK